VEKKGGVNILYKKGLAFSRREKVRPFLAWGNKGLLLPKGKGRPLFPGKGKTFLGKGRPLFRLHFNQKYEKLYLVRVIHTIICCSI